MDASPAVDEHRLLLDLTRTRFAGAPDVGSKLVLAVVKLLRLKVLAVSDFPTVDRLEPFAISEETISAETRTALVAPMAELTALGFSSALYHRVEHPLTAIDAVYVSLLHRSGTTFARVTVNRLRAQPVSTVFTQLWSTSAAGQVHLTWTRGFEFPPLDGWTVTTRRGASLAELWQAHQALPISAEVWREATFASRLESLHAALVQPQLAAGILRPLTEDERTRQGELLAAAARRQDTGQAHGDVLGELDRLQQQKRSGLGAALPLLVLSLAAFAASGAARWDGTFLAILIGVLLFHETGHYLAMRWSGYRDLKMFFIPFFGAAVSGKSWNVAGWRRVLVSLAGPVPGIIVGCVLAGVSLYQAHPLLHQVALMLLIVNGMNLLPILPLDGGWVVHLLIFVRKPFLDVAFRGLAVLALAGGWLALDDTVLLVLAIFMALGLPLNFRLARITADLRRQGFVPVSSNGRQIDPASALPVVERVLAAQPKRLPATLAARHTLTVCEALGARPPGVAASLGLLAVHGLMLLVAVIGLGVLMIGRNGGFESVMLASYRQTVPTRPLQSDQVRTLLAPPGDQIPALSLVANLADSAAVTALAADVLPTLPPDSGCVCFGDSLLITLSASGSSERARLIARLIARLSAADAKAFVADRDRPLSLVVRGRSIPAMANSAAELDALFQCSGVASLIVPWDAHDPRAPAQRDQDRACRALMPELCAAFTVDDTGPEQEAQQQAMEEAQRTGDHERVERLASDQERRRRSAVAAALDRLASAHPEGAALIAASRVLVDADLLKFYTSREACWRPWLGAVAEGAENPGGIQWGWMLQADDSWDLRVVCHAPALGAPALVRWLTALGASNLEYCLMSELPDEADVDP